MAEGDLTVDSSVRTDDEIGQMAQALATARTALRSALLGVADRAGHLAGTASALASTAEAVTRETVLVTASTEHMTREIGAVTTSVLGAADGSAGMSGAIA